MALVTHPIYAKDWSFSSSTTSFDAPSPYSLAESTSHVQSSSAVQSSTNKKSSNKRRAQELGLEWDEEDRRISWPQAAGAVPSSSSASATSATTTTALTSPNASKKAKLSDSEDTKDVSIPDRSTASASVSPKMEHVLLFLVDALTNVCAPAPPNQSSSPAPSPSQSSSSSPLLLLPAPTSQASPLASEPANDSKQPTATCEEEPDATSQTQPRSEMSIQTPQPSTPTRVRPLKSLTPPTSPLSDSEDRAPFVRKALVVRQACSARSEQKLGRWVLAKNHFLSVRCLDPRTQSIEWQQSLHNIGWEPLHPYFQAQAEAEFEAAAAAAAAESSTVRHHYSHHHHHHFNNTLSEWIEDDFDADAEYEYENESESEYDVEGDEDWGNEDEDEDVEFELPRQNVLLQGVHTGVWDSGVSLTPTAPNVALSSQQELSLDDCRC